MIALIIACVAEATALAGLILAWSVAHQSGAVASTLDRHRNAHVARDGTADPQAGGHRADRRRVNLGPPRSTGERRERPAERPELAPGPDTLETSSQAVLAGEEPPTVIARQVRLPRPGEIGRQR